MDSKLSKIIVILLCIFMGFFFSYLLLGFSDDNLSDNGIITPKMIYDYQNEIDNFEINNEELKKSIEALLSKLEGYNENSTDNESVEKELFNELEKYDIITGRIDLFGPGVEIQLSDSEKILEPGDNIDDYIIHNSDVLEIINELKAAGAEVIAINGFRIAWDSNIDCAGPVIYVDDDFIAGSPFKIEAIGDKEKMYASLESEDSLVQVLRYFEINVKIVEKDVIIIKGRN